MKQENLFPPEKPSEVLYKKAYEETKRENWKLRATLNQQAQTIKNLKRKLNEKSVWTKICRFFKPKKVKHQKFAYRPLRFKEKEVTDLVTQGYTVEELCKHFNVNRKNMLEYLRKHGLR